MNKKIIYASLLLVLSASLAHADFNKTNWQFEKEITAPSNLSSKSFVEIVFDNEIFSSAKSDLSDIRIVDASGAEVPYVLTTEAPRATRETFQAKIFNKGSKPGEFTSFIADLGEAGVLNNQLKIITDSKNFRREVSIEASFDQVNWLKLDSNKYIYDYTVEFKAQDTTIRYPENAKRYLRVTIFDRGEAPLNILRAEVAKEKIVQAKEITYDAKIIEKTENSEKRASVVTLDLGAVGLPASNLSLETDSSNFNRQIGIEGSNDKQNWSTISSGDVIFSYSTPQFIGSKLSLNYPERNFRYLRLVIFNKDDKPINITGAKIQGLLRKLVFEFNPAVSYSLFYGNPSSRFPEYDLKTYISYFNQSARPEVKLGAQKENPAFVETLPPQKPFSERYSNLLLVALILVVIVIGTLIFRLFKRA